ncbi:MAG: LysR family transcriptional regulator [Roseobacter sp.]
MAKSFHIKSTQLSLTWLGTFQHLAQHGSIQKTATQLGLSNSTVSLHLKSLENHLGVSLMDHSRRPLVLTAQGRIYLDYTQRTIALLDQAHADVTAAQPENLRSLRFAIIDDFESDISPEITRMLTSALPDCTLTSFTRPSHEILALLKNRTLDLGIATQPSSPTEKLDETPILKDPFVLAVPTAATHTAQDYVAQSSGLPFLGYSQDQIMGSMISAQLARLKIPLKSSCAFDGTASIMALISEGHGWAITTPTNYARSQRFQGQITLMPFPGKAFARTISLFVAEPQTRHIGQEIATRFRDELARQIIARTVAEYPWLTESFTLLAD